MRAIGASVEHATITLDVNGTPRDLNIHASAFSSSQSPIK